ARALLAQAQDAANSSAPHPTSSSTSQEPHPVAESAAAEPASGLPPAQLGATGPAVARAGIADADNGLEAARTSTNATRPAEHGEARDFPDARPAAHDAPRS